MQGSAKSQWTIRNGYLVAERFGYDISLERLSDPHLMAHMAEKTWCDMDELKAMAELAKSVSSFNSADDDDYDMGGAND